MTTPVRIQRRRTPGWLMPEGAVYVGRPTMWGNPWVFGTPRALARMPAVLDPAATWEVETRISRSGMQHDYRHGDGTVTICHIRQMTMAECVEAYRKALLEPSPNQRLVITRRAAADEESTYGRVQVQITPDLVRNELRGKDLACWCRLDQPCHADVLLAVANYRPYPAPPRTTPISGPDAAGIVTFEGGVQVIGPIVKIPGRTIDIEHISDGVQLAASVTAALKFAEEHCRA